MSNAIEPNDASKALDEIQRRQAQVIERTLVPAWYWWAVALPMVGLGVVVDTRSAPAIAAAAVLFALSVTLLTAWIVFGGLRRVKANDALLGPRGVGLIIGFVWLVVGGTLLLAFALKATGFDHPATVGTLGCALALVIGGPILMRRLGVIMHRHSAGIG